MKKLLFALWFLLLAVPCAAPQVLCPSGYNFNGLCLSNPAGTAVLAGQNGTGVGGQGGSITIVPGAPTGSSTTAGKFTVQLDPSNSAVNFQCTNPPAICAFNNTTVSGSTFGITVPGGTVNDTAAIQAIIDALPVSNVLVRFQPNTVYSLGAAGIHFTNFTNLEVDFNGAQFQSIATSTQNDGVGGFVDVLFTNCTNCKVHNGNFDGKAFKGGFLAFTGCTDDEVYENYVTNVGVGSRYSYGSNNSTRIRWHDNVATVPVVGSAARGFWLGNSNIGFIDTDTVVGPNNKAISNTATGFVIEAAGAQIFNNYALNNAGSGFISSTATGSQSVDHNFIGNVAIGNTSHGYQTDVTSNVPVLRVSLVGNRFEGNAGSCMYLYYAQWFSVSGNLCIQNDTGGSNTEIFLAGVANNVSVTGNTILANSLANAAGIQLGGQAAYTETDISIASNNITCGSTAQGLGIQAISANSTTVKRLTISNNVLSTCAHGISLRATAAGDLWDDVSVIGNTMTNMGTDYLKFTSAVANQITNARVIGNSGAISIDANTVLFANFANTWSTGQADGTKLFIPAVDSNSLGVGTGSLTQGGITGTGNTSFGQGNDLHSITSGNYNTVVGFQSGSSLTTGSQNMAVGTNALNLLTTGQNNVAVGFNALFADVTGSNNIALGSSALSTYTGSGDVAIGKQALTVTTGAFNTAIGDQAGIGVTTGNANSLFGVAAGGVITTGSGNIMFGPNGTITTGNNNINIGTNLTGLTPTGSNQIDVGDILFLNNASTAVPVISACGTGPTVDSHANSHSGTVTVGTVAAASCTVTFAVAYSSFNHCIVTSQSTIASFAYSYTLSAITVTGTSLVSDKFDYECDGL